MEMAMTTKTTKYSILTTVVVTALILGVTISSIEAEVSKDVSVSSGSKFDANKKAGLPYIEKSIVTSDLSIKESNIITMELTLHNAPTGSYVILKPTIPDNGFVTDPTLDREEVFNRSQLAIEGQSVPGIVTQKSLMSFDTEQITLEANQPTQFDIDINLSDTLIKQNPYSLNFNIGFDLIESFGVENVPMETGSIELRGPQYED